MISQRAARARESHWGTVLVTVARPLGCLPRLPFFFFFVFFFGFLPGFFVFFFVLARHLRRQQQAVRAAALQDLPAGGAEGK